MVTIQQPTNIWCVLKQLQIIGLSWKPPALLDLSRDSSWTDGGQMVTRQNDHNSTNQQPLEMSLNSKCKCWKHLGDRQPCWTCRVMPPGGDNKGTRSNGHNSTTVSPIEQNLTVLKSSDTALQKRSAAKQQQTPAMS